MEFTAASHFAFPTFSSDLKNPKVAIGSKGQRIVDSGSSLRISDRVSGRMKQYQGDHCNPVTPSPSARWVVLSCLLGDLDDMHLELRLVDLHALSKP